MDRERINREAMEFQKEGSCFIHVESKDGETDAIVTGKGGQVLTALALIIEQIATALALIIEQIAVANQSEFENMLNVLEIEHMMQQIKKEAGIDRCDATAFTMPKFPTE